MKNSVEGLGIFLLGTAVGAALGILFAPEAGEETRNALVETTKSSWDTIKEKVKTGEEELNKYKDEATKYTDEVVDNAKSKVKEKSADINNDVQQA